MSIFSTFETAGSGLHVYRTWLDAVSDNVANLSTATAPDQPAFAERLVVAQSIPDGVESGYQQPGGAMITAAAFGSTRGRLVYQPGHPLADANGMVRYPDMDLSDQMTSLLLAQRGYQANLAVVERAKDAYQQALEIGR
jgi:flagellar basal-body rod protein FlgC